MDDLPAQLAAALTPTIEFPQHFHQVDDGWGLFQRTEQQLAEMVDDLV